jgi:TonB-linked SusC/RagA family outer membrane protein
LNYNKDIGAGKLESFLLFSQDQKTSPGQFNTYLHEDVIAFGHYALQDRYYFDLSLSVSGSSRLPKNSNQWGFFPAAAVAWRMSQEAFLENMDWLDELKFRISFGLTGNDRISYNLDQYPFVGGSNYYFRDAYTSYSSRMEGHLPSSRVTYEKSQMLNFGIESQLFRKLTFNADLFYNKTYDIMASRQEITSSILGAVCAYEPDGKVKNYGVELGLALNDQTGDFKYNIGGQFSFARNKIVNMNEVFQPYDYLKATERPIGQIFGLETIGFFRDQSDIDQSPKQLFSTVYPGDLKYKDQNGDDQIDQYDVISIGYNQYCPEIYYSATIDLEYKRFGVNALLQGVSHYSSYLNTAGLFWPLMGNGNISEHYLDNHWRLGADNTNVKYPRLTTTESRNNYRLNSVFIANASYLKLRSAEVFYKLPSSLLSKFHTSSCKIFVRAMDLFSIDQIKAADPEAIGAVYPTLKSYHVGFSVTF